MAALRLRYRGTCAMSGGLLCRIAALPARVRAERAHRARELSQVDERARATEIVTAYRKVDVKEVFPRTPANRTGLDLGEVNLAQREHRERLEQRTGLVGKREDHGRLVGLHVRVGRAAHEQEARDVVGEILDLRLQDFKAEDVCRALGGDGRRILQTLFLHKLCA